jgi:hypothetical protein
MGRWHGCFARENILTRRANHRHYFNIASEIRTFPLLGCGRRKPAVTTGRSPKKPSACRFGGLKAPHADRIPGFSGGTSIASLIEECGG